MALDHSSPDVYLLSMTPVSMLNAELNHNYSLQCKVNYLAQEFTVNGDLKLPLDEKDLEDIQKIKFSNIPLSQQKKIDEILSSYSENLQQLISFSL